MRVLGVCITPIVGDGNDFLQPLPLTLAKKQKHTRYYRTISLLLVSEGITGPSLRKRIWQKPFLEFIKGLISSFKFLILEKSPQKAGTFWEGAKASKG